MHAQNARKRQADAEADTAPRSGNVDCSAPVDCAADAVATSATGGELKTAKSEDEQTMAEPSEDNAPSASMNSES